MRYNTPVPAQQGGEGPPLLVAWIDATFMDTSAAIEPLEVAMVICSGVELREVSAITLPVDQERDAVQTWFAGLPSEQQQRYKRSGLVQEVLSNGLMMPMVVEALAQTLDRVSEPGEIILAAEDPAAMRKMLRPLVRGFRPRSQDLSLLALRQWGEASGNAPQAAGWGTRAKPHRTLDHCLSMVDEARCYLAALAGGE